jgi:Na+/glutamate symporter
MVVPVLKNRPTIAAAVSAGVVALAANSLPYRLGLILAALVGIAIGTFLWNRTDTKPKKNLPIHANLRDSLDE